MKFPQQYKVPRARWVNAPPAVAAIPPRQSAFFTKAVTGVAAVQIDKSAFLSEESEMT